MKETYLGPGMSVHTNCEFASCPFKLDKEFVGPVRVRDCMCFGTALKSPEIYTPVPGAAK